MTSKIVVNPIGRGLKTYFLPFNIDDDSFPNLRNAYQWRGRVKRKRGNELLTRLRRFFNSTSTAYNSGSTTITLDGSGNGNILTGFSLQTNGNIFPGSVTITAPGPTVFTDPNMDGTLSPSGTINYATGAITIAAEAGAAVSVSFNYYPDLPVMGLEDFILSTKEFPQCLGFDTTYSYNIILADPYSNYDVSFYKNPANGAYPGYVQKAVWTPLTWNGQNYQQFWTINYQGALWATNGITIPFDPTNIGMQYKPISAPGIVGAFGVTPEIVNITITGHGLVVGDFIFINEVVGVTGINFQTGYVTVVVDANTVTVEFPDALFGGAYVSGGIAQYLTNRSDKTKDCIRWYDGDPTDGNIDTPGFVPGKGWVNFMPPLSQGTISIGDAPAATYYLVGARMIQSFKDRLLFFGPVIQTSASGSQIYLQDTIIYSQNGTPYYTASFNGNVLSSATVFNPILVPVNQTATANSYFEDVTGFGGFLTAGIDQPINSVSPNEDVLVLGFTTAQTRLIYTGNDIVPFNLFVINSELGTTSTFSVINMDQGILSRGNRGFIITSQTSAQRIDLENPDKVFEVSNFDNGTERFCGQRDFQNEWVYFTYINNKENQLNYRFPNETFLFNYRDNSWSIFRETFTTYGFFRKQTGFTWQTVGRIYPTWADWNDPWDAGQSTLLQQTVIGGNQQGYVFDRGNGTGEPTSLYIRDIAANVVTSPDHGLELGDFIVITGCLGSIGQQVNGKIFSVTDPSQNSFTLNPTVGTGTYSGGGQIIRHFVPFIQSKQFPTAWEYGRKTRLGVQQYLLSKTQQSQITLLIYLSQDGSNPYNDGPIFPEIEPENNSLIYSTVLYTCPESTNLGLTPLNSNLQQLTLLDSKNQSLNTQNQIWHRMNTSLIGDTVQVGFTISDKQMRAFDPYGTPFSITGATQANPCVLACTGEFNTGTMIQITGVQGMTQLNFDANQYNYYQVISSTTTHVTIEVDSTGFDMYTSGGTATAVANFNATAEVELHAMVLNVSPSQMLS